MSQPSIKDSIGKGNDSGFDGDDDLELEGKLEPRRVHPYNRPYESPPPMAFPSQSLSAVIRGGNSECAGAKQYLRTYYTDENGTVGFAESTPGITWGR